MSSFKHSIWPWFAANIKAVLTIIIFFVDICSCSNEFLQTFNMALVCSNHQSCSTIFIFFVDISSCSNEFLQTFNMALVCSSPQSCVTIPLSSLLISAPAAMSSFKHSTLALVCSTVQSCLTIFIFFVDISPCSNEFLQTFNTALVCSSPQSC